MNMNDKDWDKEEFYDDEADGDDEDNDFGNVDANNDETFDNAAEWNEDEHEELIARDSILSRTRRNNSNNNHTFNGRNHQVSSSTNATAHRASNNGTVGLNDLFGTNRRATKNQDDVPMNPTFVASLFGSPGSSGWNASAADTNLFPTLRGSKQSSSHPERMLDSVGQEQQDKWQQSGVGNQQDSLHVLQLQQQQLILQARIHEQELRQQQMRDRHVLQQQALAQQQQQQQQHQLRAQRSGPIPMESNRQVLRVDELEKQLRESSINQTTSKSVLSMPETSKRAGWSPFGGKDLFTSTESDNTIYTQGYMSKPAQILESATIERAQNFLMKQQEQQQLLQHREQIQQLELMKQQHIRQQQSDEIIKSRLISRNAQCFTVEELERQMMADNKPSQDTKLDPRSMVNLVQTRQTVPEIRHSPKPNDKTRTFQSSSHDRRNGERHDRFDRHPREASNNDQRDRRGHHRYHRREPTIIPPQVQLSVIDKAKLLHSITTMHSDEFVQDRMPTNDGFKFKRHSVVAAEKVHHDGVLTEKERSWLTRIQEKIQADYDDNIDQDYYYLLYFNRSSMTDEAAQKPSGPGVLDRRFIPRERLLYNSGI